MSGKWLFRSLTLSLLAANLATPALAAPPWSGLFSGGVEANPNKTYTLSENNGPWMIMTCSFSGKGADNQARELALELRNRYKLEAFVHRVTFDLGAAPARGVDQFGMPIRATYRHGSEIEEWAVLVGNYASVDDTEAQRVLQKIKLAQPKCLEVGEGKRTNVSLANWRRVISHAVGGDQQQHGPMGHAFITTNPVLPPEFFNTRGVDQFVLDMNRDVEFSLLDCPGKYSVQVKQFRGEVIIDQNRIRQIEGGEAKMKSNLINAGEQAERLTKALRMKGYEAYCFHDRAASIVCVGSFDSVGTPRNDGKIEINPQMLKFIEFFKPAAVNIPGQPGAIKPNQYVGETFDIQPMPVQVPKRSIGASYNRKMAALP